MERISTNLVDPVWWFTAVFVAIVASLIAGFARDWLTLWMAKRIGRFRDRRRSQLRKKARLIRGYRSSIRLYIALMFIIILDFMVSFFILVFATSLPPLYFFYRSHPEYDIAWSLVGLPQGNELVPTVVSFLLFAAMFFSSAKNTCI